MSGLNNKVLGNLVWMDETKEIFKKASSRLEWHVDQAMAHLRMLNTQAIITDETWKMVNDNLIAIIDNATMMSDLFHSKEKE